MIKAKEKTKETQIINVDTKDLKIGSKNLFDDEFELNEETDNFFDPQKIEQKEKIFSGSQGRMVFQLQKSFKGDKRFQMDERFLDDIAEDQLPEAALLNYNKDEEVDSAPFVDLTAIQKEIRVEVDRYRVLVETMIDEPVKEKKPATQKNSFVPVKRFDPNSKASQNLLIKPEKPKEEPNQKPKLKFKRSELIINKDKLEEIEIAAKKKKKLKKEQKKSISDHVRKSKAKVFEINYEHLKEYGVKAKAKTNEDPDQTAQQPNSFLEFKLFE